MTVDFDRDALTDPTCEDTTAKAILVVSPLNALISDEMERLKSLDLPCILIRSRRTSSFSSRPRPRLCTRARDQRSTGSLENEEDNNISDDSEDVEDVCIQEDLKALKEGVENLKFIFLNPEVLCQS